MSTKQIKPRLVFGAADLLPKTGMPSGEMTPEKRDGLRSRSERHKAIYVQNPNHLRVLEALDEAVALGIPGKVQYALRNSAASFSGKSASADEFARIYEARGNHRPGHRPVVRVELEQACTAKRLWTAVLREYGDGFCGKGDEEDLRYRAYDAFEQFGTVLLVLDESQHAGYRSKGGSTPTDVIKRFVSDARVTVALWGDPTLKPLLETNCQLGHRALPPCDIRPLDILNVADQATFAKFMRRYDAALVRHGLFPRTSQLDDPRTLACLMQISSGYLGRVVALAQVASTAAYRRDAEIIEPFDLSNACVDWAVDQKLTPHDPFRHGVR